jgi:DtxR family Mn-dependent transcriptional regulator
MFLCLEYGNGKENYMTVSNQKYLKAVYVLSRGGCARVVDIVDTLSVSKASVCSALRRLSDKGFVEHEPYGGVRLTETGELKAKALIASYESLKRSIGDIKRLPAGLEYLFNTTS